MIIRINKQLAPIATQELQHSQRSKSGVFRLLSASRPFQEKSRRRSFRRAEEEPASSVIITALDTSTKSRAETPVYRRKPGATKAGIARDTYRYACAPNTYACGTRATLHVFSTRDSTRGVSRSHSPSRNPELGRRRSSSPASGF